MQKWRRDRHEDVMSRPFMKEDFLLIGGVIFVIVSCVAFIIWSYPSGRGLKRRHLRGTLPAGQDLGEMEGAHWGARARERSLDLHQATGVDRHHRARAGAQD